MTRCEQCEIWKRTINPTNHDQICGCECHKAKPAQLLDISIAKDAQTVGTIKTKPEVESSTPEDAEVKQSFEIKTKSEVDTDVEEKAEAKQTRCECQWLPWIRKCYGHCSKPAAVKVKQSAEVKIKPLVDVSIAEAQQSDNSKTKSAAQIFMVEKQEKFNAKEKMKAKLALLEKEVKLKQQVLQQSRTLQESKEALLMKKVRVKYNKCHKFWRGSAISAHKPFVKKQVDAAKARLGLEKHHHQFNISAMLDTIDKLAPDGCYKSAKPSSSPSATSRPWVRPTSAPRRTGLSRFIVPPPPVAYSTPAKKSSPAPAAVSQTSSGTGGDYGIVSYGDVLDDEPCFASSTQPELCAEEYLWDGKYDFSSYINEEELEINNSDIIWEDSGFDDAKELEVQFYCQDSEVESDCYDAKVEDCNYYYFAEDCYDS